MNPNDCSKSQDLWIESLYGKISPDDSRWLKLHQSECSQCAREFGDLQQTADTMRQRQRSEPPQEYWDQYWERLSPKLQKTHQPAVIPFYRNVPVQVYRVAAAILLVLLGVIIGRNYVPPAAPPVAKIQSRSVTPVQPANLDERTNRFLERSQVLILGMIHTGEPENAMDFAVPRKVSTELIQEASTLKSELANHKRKQLKRLVSDLEFILVQISNLESEQDFSEIELLRSGVDQKGILLKINMEQMRLGTFEDSKQTPGSGKSEL